MEQLIIIKSVIRPREKNRLEVCNMDNFSQKLGKYLIWIIKGIGIFFIATVVFLLIQSPTLTMRFFNHESPHNINYIQHSLVLVIGTIVGYASINLLCKLIKSNIKGKMRTKITLKGTILALMFSVIDIVLDVILSTILKISSSDGDLVPLLKTGLAPFLIVTIIIVSPILENLFFQGFLQDGVFKKLPPLFSIALTAGLFALAHGFIPSWSTLEFFIGGISFALAYYLTDDFKMSALSHIFYNFLVLIVHLLF